MFTTIYEGVHLQTTQTQGFVVEVTHGQSWALLYQ
jgi:hypothetical protein